MPKPSNSRSALKAAYERCNGHCYYCGAELEPFGNWQVDHIEPRIYGGGDEYSNLAAACSRCNQRKGGRNPQAFADSLHDRIFKHIHELHLLFTDTWYADPDDVQNLNGLLDHITDICSNLQFQFYGERPTGLDTNTSDPIQLDSDATEGEAH